MVLGLFTVSIYDMFMEMGKLPYLPRVQTSALYVHAACHNALFAGVVIESLLARPRFPPQHPPFRVAIAFAAYSPLLAVCKRPDCAHVQVLTVCQRRHAHGHFVSHLVVHIARCNCPAGTAPTALRRHGYHAAAPVGALTTKARGTCDMRC